jgi:hypothetical protein
MEFDARVYDVPEEGKSAHWSLLSQGSPLEKYKSKRMKQRGVQRPGTCTCIRRLRVPSNALSLNDSMKRMKRPMQGKSALGVAHAAGFASRESSPATVIRDSSVLLVFRPWWALRNASQSYTAHSSVKAIKAFNVNLSASTENDAKRRTDGTQGGLSRADVSATLFTWINVCSA